MNNEVNKDLTRIFCELYAERVAIMEIDGHDNNAEYNAYADTVQSLSRKMPECTKFFASMELRKAAEQYLRTPDFQII